MTTTLADIKEVESIALQIMRKGNHQLIVIAGTVDDYRTYVEGDWDNLKELLDTLINPDDMDKTLLSLSIGSLLPEDAIDQLTQLMKKSTTEKG